MDILSNPYLLVLFNALISGGAFLFFTLGIGSLAFKYRRRSSPYLTLLCFVMGVTQLYAWLNLNTIIFQTAWANYIFVGANFFIGPGVYYFYQATAHENFTPSRLTRWTFIPGVVVLFLIPLINWVAPQAMPKDPRQFFLTGTPSFIDVLFSAAMVHNIFYYVKLFLVTRPLLKANPEIQKNGGATAFLLFFGIISFINLYGLVAYITQDIRHFYADSCVITLLIVSILVFALRYPQYFLKVKPE
ncbi:MAG TPA: hypothetical protein PLY93_11050 [Turneriella sp.]|nr:hypothetical protein [Turneriella sp.]